MKSTSRSQKTIWITFVAIAIIIISASIAWVYQRSQQTTQTNVDSSLTDAERFKQEYPQVADDNRYVYSSAEEVFRVFEQGSGIVFLGFPECPWCQALVPMLDNAAKAEQVDTIHYLNIRQARANNDDTYRKLVTLLADYLQENEAGELSISVPDVTAIANGEIVERFVQESAGPNERTPSTYWTEERRVRAAEQLRQMAAQTRGE